MTTTTTEMQAVEMLNGFFNEYESKSGVAHVDKGFTALVGMHYGNGYKVVAIKRCYNTVDEAIEAVRYFADKADNEFKHNNYGRVDSGVGRNRKEYFKLGYKGYQLLTAEYFNAIIDEYAVSEAAMEVAIATEEANAASNMTDIEKVIAERKTMTVRELFLEAKKEVGYNLNARGAKMWFISYPRYDINTEEYIGHTIPLKRTSKDVEIYLREEYCGMTLKTFLAEEKAWIDEETDKAIRQMNIDDEAFHLRDKIICESYACDDNDNVFNLLPTLDELNDVDGGQEIETLEQKRDRLIEERDNLFGYMTQSDDSAEDSKVTGIQLGLIASGQKDSSLYKMLDVANADRSAKLLAAEKRYAAVEDELETVNAIIAEGEASVEASVTDDALEVAISTEIYNAEFAELKNMTLDDLTHEHITACKNEDKRRMSIINDVYESIKRADEEYCAQLREEAKAALLKNKIRREVKACDDNDDVFNLLPTLDELNDVDESAIIVKEEIVNMYGKTFSFINIYGERVSFIDGEVHIISSDKYDAHFNRKTSKYVVAVIEDGNFKPITFDTDEEFFAEMAKRGACTIDEPEPPTDYVGRKLVQDNSCSKITQFYIGDAKKEELITFDAGRWVSIKSNYYGAEIYNGTDNKIHFRVGKFFDDASGEWIPGPGKIITNADEFFRIMSERGACTIDEAEPPTVEEIFAELPDDPNADNYRMARYITYAYSDGTNYAIRSTDFLRAEKALALLKAALTKQIGEYKFGIDFYPIEFDAKKIVTIYHAEELDGSEEDEETFTPDVMPVEDGDDDELIDPPEKDLSTLKYFDNVRLIRSKWGEVWEVYG